MCSPPSKPRIQVTEQRSCASKLKSHRHGNLSRRFVVFMNPDQGASLVARSVDRKRKAKCKVMTRKVLWKFLPL